LFFASSRDEFEHRRHELDHPARKRVADVWKRLVAGEAAPVETLENEQNGARYLVRRVPATLTAHLPPHPRLRRASAISRFAAAAGLAALAEAKTPPSLDRVALVFAISNGGVIYTRRFLCGYREVRGAICQPDAISRNGL
jgi:hypothetical protein